MLRDRLIGITGVSGFIGRHVAERCLRQGARVRGLDLHPPLNANPLNASIEFFSGNVTSVADARRLCAGCDAVIHTAAIVREGGDPGLFQRVNVHGTRVMVEAAATSRVPRFLQVSSVMVYGFRAQGEIDETASLQGDGNPYCQSKIDSEQIALAAHQPGGIEVSIVRCGDVYGPGSIPWTIRPVRMMQAGIFMLAGGGRGILNHVYIDNLVDGLLLALTSSLTGVPFNITDGQPTTCREFFEYYARTLGRKRLASGPALLLRWGLQIGAGLQTLAGREVLLHPDSIPFVTRRCQYSIARAQQLLQYTPQLSLEAGMAQTREWLIEQGLIPATTARVS